MVTIRLSLRKRTLTLISIRGQNRRIKSENHTAHKDVRNFTPSSFTKYFQLERFLVVTHRN